MRPKPDILGQRYASAFQEKSVAQAFQERPPIPIPSSIDLLV